jgi:hypothetical protein
MKTRLCAALLAASLGAAPPNPIHWKLRDAPSRPVKAGARFTVKLVAQVDGGWHLYSLKQVNDGPIATRIWVGEGQPFRLAGAVQAPPPDVRQDPSFNLEVGIYEGEQIFTLPVQVTPSATPGAQKLAVSMSYQACNNKVCLPPRTVTAEVPVEVRK